MQMLVALLRKLGTAIKLALGATLFAGLNPGGVGSALAQSASPDPRLEQARKFESYVIQTVRSPFRGMTPAELNRLGALKVTVDPYARPFDVSLKKDDDGSRVLISMGSIIVMEASCAINYQSPSASEKESFKTYLDNMKIGNSLIDMIVQFDPDDTKPKPESQQTWASLSNIRDKVNIENPMYISICMAANIVFTVLHELHHDITNDIFGTLSIDKIRKAESDADAFAARILTTNNYSLAHVAQFLLLASMYETKKNGVLATSVDKQNRESTHPLHVCRWGPVMEAAMQQQITSTQIGGSKEEVDRLEGFRRTYGDIFASFKKVCVS